MIQTIILPIVQPIEQDILARATSNLWTPASEPGLTFDLDPARSDLFTLSGSEVTAAKDAAGGTYTLSKIGTGPALDLVTTIGGYPTLQTTDGGGERLFSYAGPVMGSDVGMSLYCVGKAPGTLYPCFACVGNATPTAQKNVFLGARANHWWAGCQDATIGALGGTRDANSHVFGLEYNSGTGEFTCRVDGVLVAGPTAGTIVSSASYPSGFGVAPDTATFAISDGVYIARQIYRLDGLDSVAVRQKHERYLATKYSRTISDVIVGVGDSLTDGYGSSSPPATGYLGQLAAQTALQDKSFDYYNDGHLGNTSTDILVNATSEGQASGCRKNNIAIILIGVNDIAQSVAIGTTLANYATIKSRWEAAGFIVLFGTLFPWNDFTFTWDQSKADVMNAWIAANVAANKVIPWAGTVEMQLVAGAYQATYRNVDGHPTDLGYGAMARDAAPVIAHWMV